MEDGDGGEKTHIKASQLQKLSSANGSTRTGGITLLVFPINEHLSDAGYARALTSE